MANAKEEFINHTKGKEVFCASILYTDRGEEKPAPDVRSVLKIGYNKDAMELFLQSLNYDYDDGYGIQKVSGTIWYKDRTWSNRMESDGMEWWEHIEYPKIADACLIK